jgi:hypothetical protein
MEIQKALAQLRRELDCINSVIARFEELMRTRTPRRNQSRVGLEKGQKTQNGLNPSNSSSPRSAAWSE